LSRTESAHQSQEQILLSRIEYRATAESLKKKKFLFLTQTDPYNKDDAFHLLVQRVEALLSNESTDWVQSMIKPAKAEKPA
jgi:hypothetical protein